MLSYIGPDQILCILPYQSDQYNQRVIAYNSSSLLDQDYEGYNNLPNDLCPGVFNTSGFMQ